MKKLGTLILLMSLFIASTAQSNWSAQSAQDKRSLIYNKYTGSFRLKVDNYFNLNAYNSQMITRIYTPTYSKGKQALYSPNVSNGERNIQGLGSVRIPFSVYFRKYDSFYDLRERVKQ